MKCRGASEERLRVGRPVFELKLGVRTCMSQALSRVSGQDFCVTAVLPSTSSRFAILLYSENKLLPVYKNRHAHPCRSWGEHEIGASAKSTMRLGGWSSWKPHASLHPRY